MENKKTLAETESRSLYKVDRWIFSGASGPTGKETWLRRILSLSESRFSAVVTELSKSSRSMGSFAIYPKYTGHCSRKLVSGTMNLRPGLERLDELAFGFLEFLVLQNEVRKDSERSVLVS